MEMIHAMFNFFKKPAPAKKYWQTPPSDILSDIDTIPASGAEYTGEHIAEMITASGVPCRLVKSSYSPAVAQHHFDLVDVRQIKKIKAVLPIINAALHCQVMYNDISDIAHFSLTVPRLHRQTAHLKTAMLTRQFNDLSGGVPACLGIDTNNQSLCVDIAKMPHMLIAGSTGSGKSVCLNSIITSILFKATPNMVKFIMVDPKMVELSMYEGLPHLLQPIITDAQEAVNTLGQLCAMMDKRYQELKRRGLKDIDGTELPRIVVIIDELADLMMVSKKVVEANVIRLAQKGRAAGIHLLIATQRADVKVVTPHIRDNMPARIALTMTPGTGSRVMGMPGSDKLTGKGDALIKFPTSEKLTRFQTAFTSDSDIRAVVDYWKYSALRTEVTANGK